jgi:predicted aspartyl protease
VSTSFNPHGRLIVVETRIWGSGGDRVLRLALDTGASTTLINPAILVAIGHDPTTAPQRVQITTGSGVAFVPLLSIDRIGALGQTRINFPILCHTLPSTATIDGLLGLDFLRDRRLTIDFRAGRITRR